MKKAVILNDTSYGQHHGCETVMNNIISLLQKRGIETIATNPVGVSWQNHFFLEQMEKADIVIVNGEGTLHHSGQKVKELVNVGKYAKEKLNIPVVLINTVYQDNNLEIASYMKHFDLIFVRESYSKKDLEQYGIESKVVPDMTFYNKYNTNDKRTTSLIGVSDSIYSGLSKKLYKLSKRRNHIFLPVLTTLKIDKNESIISKLKWFQFKLFRVVKKILTKLSFPIPYKNLRSLYFLDNYSNYIDKIAELKFFIIGRFHSLCFSLKTLTPFVVIKSNSHKIEGMLYDIGIGHHRILTINEIKHININEFNEFSVDEKEKIEKYVSGTQFLIESMFDDISLLLNKNKKQKKVYTQS